MAHEKTCATSDKHLTVLLFRVQRARWNLKNVGFGRLSIIAAQLHYNYSMKTAILPSIRVDPALRASVESLLEAGETLSGFVENAVRQTVLRRQNQVEFIARGLMSLENAKRTGEYVDADAVVENLARKLAAAKAKLQVPKQ
jgi:predicted transcriptional regulator